jgi:DNA segregation ATPase FtsK/SpoIIIE, S-DNA-T family
MSTETSEPQANMQVVPLRAIEAATEMQLAGTPAPAYLDTTGDGTIRRMPVIPVPLHRHNLRGTVTYAAGLGWHRTRYHGLRFPVYLVAYLWHALRGAAVLLGRLVIWWHWTEGHILVSQAVAAGRPGHQHAMSAHTEGRKVRKSRGQIIAVCAGVVLVGGLLLARFSPWWGWAALGLVLAAVLERRGRKPGRSLIQPAIVAPKYEPPTPQVITRALGALGIAGINEAVRDGRGITFVTDVHRDGEGWSADLDLPHGVTAKMILARREQLASGLRRPLSATWPEPVPHEHEGRLRLWIGSATSPRSSRRRGRC